MKKNGGLALDHGSHGEAPVRSILSKLQVDVRAQAVTAALQRGILHVT